ncbi:MAG: sulfatase-like hydrolase/transferase [Candidatus Sumerlaeia bacterium]
MSRRYFLLIALLLLAGPAMAAGATAERSILLIIDGLHQDAPQKADMPVFNRLAKEGTLVKSLALIAPEHPHQGQYAKFQTCAIPNVMLLAGSFFIPPDVRYMQHLFFPKYLTAHGVNEMSYQSIDRNMCLSNLNPNISDEQMLEWAADTQKKNDVKFMLLHLQNVGEAGIRCSHRGQGQPWDKNIFGEGSPYLAQLAKTDAAVGRFIDDLKAMGKWDGTLLVISADHGQAIGGFHPALSADAQHTAAVFVGPGVKQGGVVAHADQIDLVPTMCALMGVDAPNPGPGCGLVLEEVKAGAPDTPTRKDSPCETYNRQFRDYLEVQARLNEKALKDPTYSSAVAALEMNFMTIQQVLDWNQAKTVEDFLARNQRAIDQARARIKDPRAGWGAPPNPAGRKRDR